jgi:hypothetical protein
MMLERMGIGCSWDDREHSRGHLRESSLKRFFTQVSLLPSDFRGSAYPLGVALAALEIRQPSLARAVSFGIAAVVLPRDSSSSPRGKHARPPTTMTASRRQGSSIPAS